MAGRAVRKAHPSGRRPVQDGLPPNLPIGERRAARMRIVAARRLAGITVVLDGLHDPHNISAVLRSCDGFGVQHVHLLGAPADLPISRMITRSCEKWLSLHYHHDAATCAAELHAQGFRLWAADPDRSAPAIETIDFSAKIALVFGAEHHGLSRPLLDRCDGRYQIPMPGFSQSLNVSVAAAVSLYVGTAARRRALGTAGDLSPEEIETLAQTWIGRDTAGKRQGHPHDAPNP